MEWPIYFKDLLKVGNPESNVGVATLWTEKELFGRNLNPDSFALVGQLYSKEGISHIIRNVLAKPKIRYLILCGTDKSGSGQALVNLMEKGVNDKHEIIGVDNAVIEPEIPRA
ncbi:MAG: hypothetical protein GOV15_04130, partial [Candidatus Diapherotrites archaeon]|nr:hypothetical protein [Candidatus Diapherotrites archaeon]